MIEMELQHYDGATHEELVKECNKKGYSFNLEDYDTNIIVVNNKENYFTGKFEIVDGNHRFAIARENDELENIKIYTIDYSEAEKLGLWDNDENQEEFEAWVKETGVLVDIEKCVLPELS